MRTHIYAAIVIDWNDHGKYVQHVGFFDKKSDALKFNKKYESTNEDLYTDGVKLSESELTAILADACNPKIFCVFETHNYHFIDLCESEEVAKARIAEQREHLYQRDLPFEIQETELSQSQFQRLQELLFKLKEKDNETKTKTES